MSKKNSQSQQNEVEMYVSGGKGFFRNLMEGISHGFTGIIDGKQYVEGQEVPTGGDWDLDGYHVNGKVYK